MNFSCAICGKSYERRDLRERHRRRCEKSLDKVRSPRRKSCNSCARSKVKCDLQVPACQRCKDRQTDCAYPADSTTNISQWRGDMIMPLPTTSGSLIASPNTTASTDTAAVNSQLGDVSSYMEPILIDDGMNVDWDIGLSDGSTMDFWNTRAWNLTPAEMEALSTNTVHEVPSSSNSIHPETTPDTTASQQLLNPDFLSRVAADYHMPSVDDASPNGRSQSPISTMQSNPSPGAETQYADSVRVTRSSGQNQMANGSSSMGMHAATDLHRARFRVPDTPTIRRFESSVSSTAGSPAHQPSRNVSRRASSHATDPFPSPQSCSSSPPAVALEAIQSGGPFSVTEIMKVICDYPKQMLRPNFWSPFVHHRHYRCSQGGLAEPIAIALCCVSANQQFAESSLSFLCNLINTQRQRLVDEFPTKSENLEDAMAALHAMCIYQIETILVFRSQKSGKPQLSSAELHQHFLLQMTRRLCQKHMNCVTLKDNNAIDWHAWALAETLRRTTFLVNMVNELSYHAKALELVYYEPLNPSLVLDMPLPAPDSMWHALNENDWADARDATGWTGPGVLTLRDAITRYDKGGSVVDGCSLSQGGKQDNIQPISNLIISSAKHIGQQSQQFSEKPFKVN